MFLNWGALTLEENNLGNKINLGFLAKFKGISFKAVITLIYVKMISDVHQEYFTKTGTK